MLTQPLLLELLTEELPPKILARLGRDFAAHIAAGLTQERFLPADGKWQYFATPRRLAVLFSAVLLRQEDEEKIKKGPAVARSWQDNQPTAALTGFLRANKLKVTDLKTLSDGKQDIYCYSYRARGEALALRLPAVVSSALKKLSVPRQMHWGNKTYTFVRPVHGIVALAGERVLPLELFGCRSGRTTRGHRVLAERRLTINTATAYAEILRTGFVIADLEIRRQDISRQIAAAAAKLKLKPVIDEDLLDEITALVEWPVVLVARFAPQFLQIPQECLILTMQKNQKYIPLLGSSGQLANNFLLAANLQSQDSEVVIAGNERVLQARLADASFFYEEDKKIALSQRLEQLKNVVYQHQIGSQYERTLRLTELAAAVAAALGLNKDDSALATRAARLAKADLVTAMVGEFPELQGVMGKYYALHDKEPRELATAIEQHYWPRFAGDVLPQTTIAATVALADKLETLVGIWGVGLKPSGDKDPYGLRRAALGVIRILFNYPLDLKELLHTAYALFKPGLLAVNTAEAVYEFILTRLQVYLERTYPVDIVSALLVVKPTQFELLQDKLTALTDFKKLPAAAFLGAANKRAGNILKKARRQAGAVSPEHLRQKEEIRLWEDLVRTGPLIDRAVAAKNYREALHIPVQLVTALDDFFTGIMVMTDDEILKQNRLNLLAELYRQLNAVADLSYFQKKM